LEIIEHIDIIHMVDLIYGRGLRQMASKETNWCTQLIVK